MIPPVYALLSASTVIAAVFGTPIRIWPWGEARQQIMRPYATWGVVSGVPQNYLGQVPDIDSMLIQIDVWTDTAEECLDAATAIRDELEPAAHMVSFGSMDRDPDTKAYRMTLEFDFWTDR